MSNDFDNDARDDPDLDATPMRGSELVAIRRNIVRSIRVPFTPHQDMEIAFDELRFAALHGRGRPLPGIRILAPSYSGKSTGVRDYIEKVMARGGHPEGSCTIAYAKLDTEGTVGSLATDILKALNVKRPESLTPQKRWERAREKIKEKQVQLFVLDEFQRAGRRPTISPVIAGKIMDIMEDGDCACAFIGKPDAKNIFKACPDLGNRLDAPVTMPRLNWASEHDREMFIEFVAAFDRALKQQGATQVLSDLAAPGVAQLLLEASNGLIGQFCRIIETAVMAITRRGQEAITPDDLEAAVDEWSIGNDRIAYNPVRDSKQAVHLAESSERAERGREDVGDERAA